MSETTQDTNFYTLARGEGEDFQAYRARRKAMKAVEKAILKGTLFHDSARHGTYRNSAENPDKLRLKLYRHKRGIRK